MARRPLNKTNAIASAYAGSAKGLTPSGFKSAALFKVKPDGSIDGSNEEGVFYLNPETIEDSKTSGWVSHNIPGQSDPILQWRHGGPRTISFEALVTNETSQYVKNNANPLGALAGAAIAAVGSIASAFAQVNVPLGSIIGMFNKSSTAPTSNLDISRQLDYYRSLLYPTYSGDLSQITGSPPLLVLYFGTSLSSVFNLGTTGSIDPYSDIWVLTDLNIKITKQNPDLSPLEATVDFKLMQYTFTARDADAFGF
jgi:hypothetical protein